MHVQTDSVCVYKLWGLIFWKQWKEESSCNNDLSQDNQELQVQFLNAEWQHILIRTRKLSILFYKTLTRLFIEQQVLMWSAVVKEEFSHEGQLELRHA